MRSARAGVLIVAMAGIALAVVHLRTEQTRLTAGLLRAESQWIALRREWWSLQTLAARLQAPEHMRRRVAAMYTELVPPTFEQPPTSLHRPWDRFASLGSDRLESRSYMLESRSYTLGNRSDGWSARE